MRKKVNSVVTKILFVIFISIVLFSCTSKSTDKAIEEYFNSNNIVSILKKCKGHAVVVSTGYALDEFHSNNFHLLIKDDSSNFFEYIGARYNVFPGDTLK